MNREKVIVFIHIPKTGGNSINANIRSGRFVTLSHAVLRKKLDDDHVPVGLVGTHYTPSINHIVFSTVRNPLTFLRSYYHHVAGHGRFHNKAHYDYPKAEKGFSYLVEAILDREGIWPSRKFLYPQLFNQHGDLVVNWINRNETMDQDMKRFADIAGFSYKTGEKKRAAPVKALSEYYSDKQLQMIMDNYKREFMLFGYNDKEIENDGILTREVTGIDIKYNYLSDELCTGISF